MGTGSLVMVVVLALVLAYVNGMHDASSAVSTTITTRTLRESTALGAAALLNFLGALLGLFTVHVSMTWALGLLGVEKLVARAAAYPHELGQGLIGVTCAALIWLILTWWLGMPTSTLLSVYGGLIGASVALDAPITWSTIIMLVLVPLALGPLVAGPLGYLFMNVLLALDRSERLRSGHLRFL